MNTNSFLLQTGTGFATQWSDCFPLCNAIRLWFPNFLSLWITDRPPNFNQIQVALKSLKHVAQQWHIAGMMALNFSPNSSGRRQICVQGIGAGQGKLCELLHDGFTEAKKKKKKFKAFSCCYGILQHRDSLQQPVHYLKRHRPECTGCHGCHSENRHFLFAILTGAFGVR